MILNVPPRSLAPGMQILEVNGAPRPDVFIVGKVRLAFGLPWSPRRWNVWERAAWPGGSPALTLADSDTLKVRFAP